MSKFTEYLHQSLAASGFCVVDSGIARHLRPDIWPDGRQAGGDFAVERKRGFTHPVGAAEYLLRLTGIDHDLQLLARHPHGLLERIQWVTGMDVISLHPMADLQGTVQPLDLASTPTPRTPSGGDLFTIQTQEPGRTCSSCDLVGGVNSCLAKDVSGVAFPELNTPRRCPAFKPKYDSYDMRTGAMLWPELFIKEINHGA